MKKIISLLIVLVISLVFVPEAAAAETEQWELIGGDCTLIKGQNGTVTANGNWIYNYQGAIVSGSYSNAPVTIAGSSISMTALGQAYNPSAPMGYQYSSFTLILNGKACNGHGSGTYAITFTTFGWPSSISGTWKGTRTSGSGITAVAMPWIPLLMLDD